MADWRRYFSGVYLSAPDLTGDVSARITGARGGDVEDPEKGTVRRRLIVELDGHKPWIPCKTSAACLGAMFGHDESAWVGHTVVLYHDPTVRVGSEVVGGIRVRGGDIPKPLKVKIKLAKRSAFTVELRPLAQAADVPSLEAVLQEHGVTVADLDRARERSGKPAAQKSEYHKIAAYFAANPDQIEKLKEKR